MKRALLAFVLTCSVVSYAHAIEPDASGGHSKSVNFVESPSAGQVQEKVSKPNPELSETKIGKLGIKSADNTRNKSDWLSERSKIQRYPTYRGIRF